MSFANEKDQTLGIGGRLARPVNGGQRHRAMKLWSLLSTGFSTVWSGQWGHFSIPSH